MLRAVVLAVVHRIDVIHLSSLQLGFGQHESEAARSGVVDAAFDQALDDGKGKAIFGGRRR